MIAKHRNRLYHAYRDAQKAAKQRIAKVQDQRRRKALQQEYSYLSNAVDSYGFNFYPEVYVEETINKIQNIAQ